MLEIRHNGEDRLMLGEKARRRGSGSRSGARTKPRIEEYKKNADAQLEKLRKETQAQTDMLHDQAKQAARKEREGTPT